MCFHKKKKKKKKNENIKKEIEMEVPMKSITRRPSEYRPDGVWKNVSPLGGGACPNAADKPPVSEFESPKLNMAGKLHLDKAVVGFGSNANEITRPKIMTYKEYWGSMRDTKDINFFFLAEWDKLFWHKKGSPEA